MMRNKAIYRILAIITLLLMTNVSFAQSYQPQLGPGASSWADPAFQALWARSDKPIADGVVQRSWTWGPGPGRSMKEDIGPNLNDVLVQYTDKARMELPNPNGDRNSPWFVTSGLLVKEMVTAQVYSRQMNPVALQPAQINVAGDDSDTNAPTYASFTNNLAATTDRTDQKVDKTIERNGTITPHISVALQGIPEPKYAYFEPTTGHNIADVFWAFLNQTGKVYDNGNLVDAPLFNWVYVMGYPISEPYWTQVQVGGNIHDVIVQLFERRTLTYDIGQSDPKWQVQMGNVGQHYYAWRYSTHPQPMPPAPTPPAPAPPNVAPAAAPTNDTFIRISGDQFTYQGGVVKLKGSNYFNSQNPWAEMWRRWDGPQVDADLSRVSALGGNVIRISLPYDNSRTEPVVWQGLRARINPVFIQRINELLQIAAKYQLKVDVSLFDWYDDAPGANTPDDNQNMMYVDAIVGAFAGDDRIFAWDIHNEADIYFNWKHGRADKVLAWMSRVAGEIRRLDPNHPIGISMSDYHNLYYKPDPSYKSAIELSDFVALHCYDAGAIQPEIIALKNITSKPILLQETGWPTVPGSNSNYNEPTQRFLYSLAVQAVQMQNTAGLLQWTLFDYIPGTSGANPTDPNDPLLIQDHFGLLRVDGSYKPAADVFRSYSTISLPSKTQTNAPLTRAPKDQW